MFRRMGEQINVFSGDRWGGSSLLVLTTLFKHMSRLYYHCCSVGAVERRLYGSFLAFASDGLFDSGVVPEF